VTEHVQITNINCLKGLKTLKSNSVDSIVTDPPYGIKFMGKKWDNECPPVEVWQECLRVIKPGGHLLSFSGTRMIDFIMGRIRAADFEIRDTITWLYGGGFPKSLNVSKAIEATELRGQSNSRTLKKVNDEDKTSEGTLIKTTKNNGIMGETKGPRIKRDEILTKEAMQWDGWGTALKPACEFIVMARKPLSEDTVAKNVLKHSTGGINVDACRVEVDPNDKNRRPNGSKSLSEGGKTSIFSCGGRNPNINGDVLDINKGRFPSNLILDEESSEMLDDQTGILKSGAWNGETTGKGTQFNHLHQKPGIEYYRESEEGGASRFFYCAKSPHSERGYKNIHPTVKPIDLMKYLIKMVTPNNGIVLDPYMGSGSTGVACLKLSDLFNTINFIGFEISPDYFEIAKRRLVCR